jgi:hypothetical protein
VLFAGNLALQPQVRELLTNEGVDLYFADNVRAGLADETLESAQTKLAVIYDDYVSRSPGGFGEVSGWSKVGVLPAAQSATQILAFLEAAQPKKGPRKPVIGVDLGSATTMVSAMWQGRRHVSVRSDLGLGHSMRTTLDAVDLNEVAQWLSFKLDDVEDLRDYAWNKWTKPFTVPQSARDLEIEMAFAREIIRTALVEARRSWRRLPHQGMYLPETDTIVLAGAVFGSAPHPGYAALLALDALEPVGITRLLIDPYGLMAGLGAFSYLGAVTPEASIVAAQVIGGGGLPALATVVAPMGQMRAGRPALSVQTKAAGSKDEPQAMTVRAGAIRVIPLEPGRAVDVMVKPNRRLDVGRGPGRPVTFRVEGSILGLVCDARGRSLKLPRTYPRWVAQITRRRQATSPEDEEAEEEEVFEEVEEEEEAEGEEVFEDAGEDEFDDDVALDRLFDDDDLLP